ncbi:MAG: ACT domain-containing protein [Candidatus Bathyarchaeia archaeon]
MPLLQLSVLVENKPGVMARVASILDGTGVRIFALSIAEAGEVGMIRMVVDDYEEAARALEAAGFSLAKSKKNVEVIVVLVTEDHKLSEITKYLGDNDINIDYAYSSSIHLDGKSAFIFRVSDPERSERILESKGVKVLRTQDLKGLSTPG